MKILNLLANFGYYPNIKVSDKKVDEKIFKSLLIDVDKSVQDRAVIAYEELTGLKAIAYQTNVVLKSKTGNIIQNAIVNISNFVNILLYNNRVINKISLVPENTDYPGFILVFQSQHSMIKAIQIALQTENDEVVITNQSTFVTQLDNIGNQTSGNLTVIHCQEHQSVDFTYFATDIATVKSDILSTCSKGKLYIEPIKELSNNHYELRLVVENCISTDPKFLTYLLECMKNDVKQVYNILEDEILKESALESFRTNNKYEQYKKNLSYNSSKVI